MASSKTKRKKIKFLFEAKNAGEVVLVGDFNLWDLKKHPMKRNERGVWEKTVLLPPGIYEYKFLVDGRWKEDPQNSQRCSNCYGTYNNVLNVSI